MTAFSSDESTYYEILEVAPSSSTKEIHKAYMNAKQTYSPDSPALYTMFSPDEARQLLRLIEEAYGVLSSQARREQYDESLARRGVPGFSAKEKNPAPVVRSGWAPSALGDPAGVSASTPALPTEEGALVRRVKDTSSGELPEGFARTRFGVYEVNPRLEEELGRVTECDGLFLQKLRQYKKVSLDQLSDATKISKSYIAAIEANALNALPAAVFVRGFVSQLARALGVNDRTLTEAYMKYFRNQNRG